jgi:hypothetical protein
MKARSRSRDESRSRFDRPDRPGRRGGARRGERLFRLLTAHVRSLPYFVIIGAQKCGTTFLYNPLDRHHVAHARQLEDLIKRLRRRLGEEHRESTRLERPTGNREQA